MHLRAILHNLRAEIKAKDLAIAGLQRRLDVQYQVCIDLADHNNALRAELERYKSYVALPG